MKSGHLHIDAVILSDICQIKTNTIWFHVYVESKAETNKHNKTEIVIDIENKVMIVRGEVERDMGKISDED